ncbi:MAG: DUF6064 family protein [Ktedonobacterales bacterium]
MSTEIKTRSAPWETPAKGATQIDSNQRGKSGGPQDSIPVRRPSLAAIGLVVAVVATLVIYGIFIVHPYPHTPLNQFLAMFDRGNAEIWPMQLVWYVGALAMVGLALWPVRRATQQICLIAAAYLVWVGIAYFGVIDSGMHLAGLWIAVFILEAVLLLFAGIVRRDLMISPRWNLASVLGGLFMGYALVAYPIIGLLGGHPLSTLPMFGLAPCPTVIFFFGLLLWARPPAPTYLLPLLLAWGLCAAPAALGTGIVADVGLVVAGVTTAATILWRDRTSSWQTVVAGLLLTLTIALSGHDDLLIGVGLVLVLVTLAQTIRGTAPKAPQSRRLPEPTGSYSSSR